MTKVKILSTLLLIHADETVFKLATQIFMLTIWYRCIDCVQFRFQFQNSFNTLISSVSFTRTSQCQQLPSITASSVSRSKFGFAKSATPNDQIRPAQVIGRTPEFGIQYGCNALPTPSPQPPNQGDVLRDQNYMMYQVSHRDEQSQSFHHLTTENVTENI